MHFTATTSRACMVDAVNVTLRLSPVAIGAAFVAVAPSVIEPFVPAPLAPAIEIAGAVATAGIAAYAAARAADVHTWSDARSVLREVLPYAPKNEGGAALGVLRLACGVDRVRDTVATHALQRTMGLFALRRIPKLLGGAVARGAQALVPGAGRVLQGVRAATTALDAVAFVTTLEALARRAAELAETRKALTHVDLPGASEPTVPAAA